MKNILKDRLNHLRSELKQITSAKMDKKVDDNKRLELFYRIDEVVRLIAKLEKTKLYESKPSLR